MDIVTLPIERRDGIGTATARRLRNAGRIPAVLYGLGRPALAFSVEARAFRRFFDSGYRVFDLKLEGKERIGLLTETQANPIGEGFLHLDFSRVDEDQPVEVRVALVFSGEPEIASGAYMEHPVQELEVSCMPRTIPASIEVSLAGMKVGSHLEASQVKLPEGVTLVGDPTAVIATYHYKHAGEEAEEEADEVTEAEPEVLRERKPAED